VRRTFFGLAANQPRIRQLTRNNLRKNWRTFCLTHKLMVNTDANASFPGQDLVEQGLADLSQDRLTDCSLLVLIAAPRLRRLGIAVPHRRMARPIEHELYERLEERLGTGAYSYYNSLIRRVASYARALEREQSRL
jgi:hypothetical protein